MFADVLLLLALQVFGNANNPSLDKTAPTVTISSPTSGTTYDAGTASSVTLSGTSSDASGIAICRATNAATGTTANATTAADGSWSLSVSLSVGSNAVTVTCLDPGNNQGTDLLTVSRTAPSAATYYVANKCANNGNGLAATCAASLGASGYYNNLQSALTAAIAGSTIIVYGPESGNSDYVTANGTGYTNAAGFTFANSGVSGNPITLRNASNERPVLRPCASGVTDLSLCNRPTLNTNDKEYITITSASCPTSGAVSLGLHIYGAVLLYDFPVATEAAMSHGSEVSCTEVERGYSSIDDGNWSGIWLAGQYGATVRHNNIHDITYAGMTNTGAQSSTSGIKLFETSNSIFRNNTINHVIPTQAGGIDCKADCVSNQMYENDIRDVSICLRVENQETGGGPYTTNGATGSVFRNNLCVSAASSVRGGVRMEGGKTTDVAIYNNTFANFIYGIEEVHNASEICQGISFYNNALYGTTDAHVYLGDGGFTECTLVAPSNYNYYGTAASTPRYRYNNTAYVALANFTATGFDAQSTETAEANFLFTDAAGGTYTLQAGSPLQSAGRVGGTGSTTIDVGAYTDAVACVGYACSASVVCTATVTTQAGLVNEISAAASDGSASLCVSGVMTISSAVTVTKSLTIRGAVNCTLNADNVPVTTDTYSTATTTCANGLSFSGTGVIDFQINGGLNTRLAHLSLTDAGGSAQYEIDFFQAAANTGRFRLDHTFMGNGIRMQTQGPVYGVLDHNFSGFTDTTRSLNFFGYYSGDYTDADNVLNSAADGSVLTQVFVEDNVIGKILNDSGHYACVDGWGGSMITVRFNKFYNCWVEVHGTDTSNRFRTAKLLFVYHNQFIGQTNFAGGTTPCVITCYVLSNHRGGQMMVFGNAITSGGGGWPSTTVPSGVAITIHNERYDRGQPTFQPWGTNAPTYDLNAWCDGANQWDYNIGGVPRHCLDGPCWGAGSTLTGNLPVIRPWPVAGQSDQVIQPCYAWSNTRNGATINMLWDAGPTQEVILKVNVDYFNVTSQGTSVPGSCSTVNSGFVDTDGANWNTNLAGSEEVLYQCNGSIYVLYFTPPTYPHALNVTP